MAKNGKRALELMETIQSAPGQLIMNEIRSLSWSTYTFEENFQELRSALESVEDPANVPLMFRRNRSLLAELQREVARLLHNFVASVQSLIDHTRITARSVYAEADADLKEYQRRVDLTFREDPLSQFVRGLRQYSLHYKLPFIGWVMSFSNESSTMSQAFFLNTAVLLEFDGWPAPAKRYLDDAGERIDLVEAVSEYRDSVRDFYLWFEDDVRDLHSDAIEQVREYEEELALIELEGSIAMWEAGPPRTLGQRIENLFVQVLSTEELDRVAEAQEPQEKMELAIQLVRGRVSLPVGLENKLRGLLTRENG
ncbi:MAG: hypothetical protein H0V97_04155 [Actinobacteria bacterium]|nr:hypothetical protein [Actinomycetota bacterium]